MKSFLSAIAFLTIIRIPGSTFDGKAASASFAWVGLLIGGGLALVHWLAPAPLAPVLMVIYLVVITGALHLDGLADSADALFSHRDRQRKLEIMRDVHVGTMGVVAVVLVLGSKFYAFLHLDNLYLLIAIPAFARFAMVLTMSLLPYARSEGLAKPFFGMPKYVIGLQALTLGVAILAGWQIFFSLLIAYGIFLTIIIWWYKRTIGGITGDMLGAQCEVCEALLFLVVAAMLHAPSGS